MTRQDLVKLRQLLGTFLDHIPGLSEIATEYAQEMPYILHRSFQSQEWVEEDLIEETTVIVSLHPSDTDAGQYAHGKKGIPQVLQPMPQVRYYLFDSPIVQAWMPPLPRNLHFMVSQISTDSTLHILGIFYENMEQFLLDSQFTSEEKEVLLDHRPHFLNAKKWDSTNWYGCYQLHSLKMGQDVILRRTALL